MAAEASIRYQFSEDRARRLFHQASDDALVTPTESGLRIRGRGADPFVCGFGPDSTVTPGSAKDPCARVFSITVGCP